ncbi:MAG: hypothetical protein AAGG72_05260 [Pseudomonadota bacterium]
MSANHFMEQRPNSWWLDVTSTADASVTHTSDTGASQGQSGARTAMLYLGQAACRLDEIADYSISETRERDNQGLLLSGISFLLLAILFLTLVTTFGWRPQFWIAVGFCSVFSIVSLFEAMRIEAIRIFNLAISCDNGDEVGFVTTDTDELFELLDLLDLVLASPDVEGVIASVLPPEKQSRKKRRRRRPAAKRTAAKHFPTPSVVPKAEQSATNPTRGQTAA